LLDAKCKTGTLSNIRTLCLSLSSSKLFYSIPCHVKCKEKKIHCQEGIQVIANFGFFKIIYHIRTMLYRQLGATGLDVSILSFGASSLGGVFHDIDEGRAIEAVYAAIDSGINFIDVSPYYGFTKAETVLGKALKHIDRKSYYLSTKVGRYGKDGVKTWDYSGKRAVRSVEESMDRLNIEYIDLINCHDIEFSDLNQIIQETLPALHEMKNKGVVGHVGITGLPLDQLKYLVEKAPKGHIETILNFCHYCINDDALADDTEFYHGNNVGIINASPLSMGLLSERGAPAWHPASNAIKNACKKAADHCKSKDYPIEKLAIQYAVNHPYIATTLVSTSNPDNIIKNARWTEEAINKQLLAEVQEILKPIYRETWENS